MGATMLNAERINVIYEVLLSRGRKVEIVSWTDSGIAAHRVSHLPWSKTSIRPEQCWYNAYLIAENYRYCVEYVEGLVIFDDEIVEHGWNSINGKHFDLTWEYYRPSYLKLPHYELISGSVSGLEAQGYVFMPDVISMVGQYRRKLLAKAAS